MLIIDWLTQDWLTWSFKHTQVMKEELMDGDAEETRSASRYFTEKKVNRIWVHVCVTLVSIIKWFELSVSSSSFHVNMRRWCSHARLAFFEMMMCDPFSIIKCVFLTFKFPSSLTSCSPDSLFKGRPVPLYSCPRFTSESGDGNRLSSSCKLERRRINDGHR